ncbi:GFO_IDH_MocA domain-containing protein [Gammaproteobacteria bacterium]
MSISSPVRLGIIGVGRWGSICVRTLAAMTTVNLVAIASSNPETATLAPHGCHIFSDWRDLIRSADVEGLIIATPPATHAIISNVAIAAGLPIFVEKPLTLSSVESHQLRTFAEMQGARVFFVDHIHLFSSAFRRLKELVVDAGPILAIEGLAGNYGPYRKDVSTLWDWGAHDVAMLIGLVGTSPVQVMAQRLDWRQIEGNQGETIRLNLSFGKVEAKIIVSTLRDKVRQFRVRCEGGDLLYDDLAPAKLTSNGVAIEIDPAPPLTLALSEFAAAIRGGSIHLSGLDLGVAVVEVLERAGSTLRSAGPL